MKLKNNITGTHIRLRTATEDDAQFILDLRLNPKLNKYLTKTDPSVEKQKEWLRAKLYQENDYHMIIESLKGEPLGVVAVYNINPLGKTFEWGRWIVKPEAPKFTGLESALLCYELAFDHLGLQKAIFGVMHENERVISFHRRFGATIVREDPDGPWFEFTKEDFEKVREKYLRFIQGKDEEQKKEDES
jgi:RimJ/RimL family protein N-acetyltransferase